MPMGICKLCGEEKELLKSHLIPAAAFKPLSAREASNPNPLIVTNEWIGQSSEQIAAHYVAVDVRTYSTKVAKNGCCRSLRTSMDSRCTRWWRKPNPYSGMARWRYTAPRAFLDLSSERPSTSVWQSFWKASARDWGTKGRQIYIDLGFYAEPVRQFVLGRAPFPGRMCLGVCVLPPTVPLLATLMPIQTKQREFHRFKFYVPGVEFALNVGKQVPPEMLEWSATGAQQIVSSSPEFARKFGKNYVDALATARISPNFSRHLKERGRR
jgi:hypothetical protein